MTSEKPAERTDHSLDIWNCLISNEFRASRLTMGWEVEGQVGPAAREFALRGLFLIPTIEEGARSCQPRVTR